MWRSFVALLVVVAVSGSVTTLGKKNWEETVGSGHTLVEFYAPWCGHCKTLEPEFDSAAKELSGETAVKLAKVDATVEEDLAKTHKVEGFPTLKLFKDGEFVKDYNGKRTSESIVKFMKKQSSGESSGESEEETDEDTPSDNPEGEMPPGEGMGEGEGGKQEPTVEAVGLINLDSVTFNKIVGHTAYDVLVKFDVAYPHGDAEDAFVRFTHLIANLSAASSFLVSTVGIEDYGDKVNQDLADRFNLKTDDFPAFRLWKRGTKEPIAFKDTVGTDSLSRFISKELGLWIGLPGCLEAFDKFAGGFMELAKEEQTTRQKQAEEKAGIADASEQQSAKYYARVMQRVIIKGLEFPQKEAIRLEKLMESKVTDEKKAEMVVRLNILSMYGAQLTPKQPKKADAPPPEEEAESNEAP